MSYNKKYYDKNKAEISKRRKLQYQKEKAHSTASPSALHRLLVCPGSAVLTRYLPEQPTSCYAAEGTLFHECMEQVLQAESLSPAYNLITLTDLECVDDNAKKEMTSCVEDAYEWFKIESAGATKVFTELKLPMFYSDRDYGTMDCALLYQDSLTVIDWKYGKGVDVSVEYNPQLISYAVSMLKYLASNGHDIRQIKKIKSVIYQPRTYRENKAKVCEYTLQELIEASKPLKLGVDTVYDILSKYKNKNSKIVTANLNPTDEGCRFCPAKMKCKKYIKQSEDLLGDLISKAEQTKINEEKELVAIGKLFEESLPKLEKFYKELQEHYMSLPELPEGVYSANRAGRMSYISDTEKVISVLSDQGVDVIDHSTKLVTITELKKLVKKLENKEQILAEITEKKEGSKYITFTAPDSECSLIDNL